MVTEEIHGMTRLSLARLWLLTGVWIALSPLYLQGRGQEPGAQDPGSWVQFNAI